ncbi:MAG: hydroxyacid dehydrogenase [Bacteroidetes bacterium]|nr:hydroxyacid dehydrogenase [Bacteroidota bacterium]
MKALITDDVHPLLIEQLTDMGYEVHFRPDITFSETLDIIAPYTGLIINSKIFCGAELLSKAPDIKWVGRLGSGMEVIDTRACDERGVKYFNSPEGNRNAVAEHALGLLLNLLNNITQSNNEVKQGKWIREANRGEELSGKTVGIIAYGNTGESFAKVLRGFDVKVLAYDKYKKSFGNDFVKESTLEEIFNEADIVSLHLPLTDETKYMADEAFFDSFRKPVYLINTSRGKVLKTTALIEAVRSGKVKAAALDVLENEKIGQLNSDEQQWFDALKKEERIILTPHIAGWTHESKRKIAEVVVERVKGLNL